MAKYTHVLFLILVGCTPAPNQNYRYIDTDVNVNHLQQAVVALVSVNNSNQIEGPKCTAFFISPRRLATALHCIEGNRVRTLQITPNLILQINENTEIEPIIGREITFVDWNEHNRYVENYTANAEPTLSHATVINLDSENDIVILELNASENDSEHWLPLAQQIRVGQRTYAIGMPRNQFWLLSEGIISAIRTFPGRITRIYHHNLIAPGSSGSPLINDFGEVVGITTQYVRDIPNLGIAVPFEELQKLIEARPQRTIVMTIEEAIELFLNGNF